MKKIRFMDVELFVSDDVFTPRPETGLLVNVAMYALVCMGLSKKSSQVLDMGTGSGNIAISLTKLNKGCKLVSLDVKKEALEIAKSNASLNGVLDRIQFVKSDLFKGLPKKFMQAFDVIVSNPPYVARWEISTLSEVVQGEPRIALDGGEDGLSFYRKICTSASDYLKPGGYIVMEMGYNQQQFVKAFLTKTGRFTDFETFKDDSGIERVIMAKHAE